MRFGFLDVLRGVALLGILVVNAVDVLAPPAGYGDRRWLDLAVQSRFVPIFTLLFGASLFLIADGARDRDRPAWSPLVRRTAGLGAIGLLHATFFSGDILREYAVAGLLVVPLVVWAPARLNLALGAVLTGVSFGLLGGGVDSLPGLMLVGAGAAGLGLPERIERSARAGWVLVAVGLAVAVPAVAAHIADGGGDPRFSMAGTRAGLAMAVAYIGVLAVLWHRPAARSALRAVFAPLGRMSLTAYVTASVVLVAVAATGSAPSTIAGVAVLAVAVIAAQSLASRAWLRFFRYGPLEWLLRIVTRWSYVPLRRDRCEFRDRPAADRDARADRRVRSVDSAP